MPPVAWVAEGWAMAGPGGRVVVVVSGLLAGWRAEVRVWVVIVWMYHPVVG